MSTGEVHVLAPTVPEASRDAFTGRRARPFQLYVAAVTVCGLATLVTIASTLDLDSVLSLRPAFWTVCALLVVAELRPLVTSGGREATGYVLTTAFVFALLLRLGLPVAVLVQALATAGIELSRGKALWRIGFNVAQYTLSWTTAAGVIHLLGHNGSIAHPENLVAADCSRRWSGASPTSPSTSCS